MKGLSKSRYTAFCQCPKNLWLKVFKPEEATVDAGVQARFEQGNVVGDLVMQLFGDFKEAHAESPDGRLDLATIYPWQVQDLPGFPPSRNRRHHLFSIGRFS